MSKSENNQMTFYETEDGKVRIKVRFENEKSVAFPKTDGLIL